jgi:hypothetical protein
MEGMAKRLQTYRVDEDLGDAVIAEAARRGETVTDVIIRAFREYIKIGTGGAGPGPGPSRKSGKDPCPHRVPPGAWCKRCAGA